MPRIKSSLYPQYPHGTQILTSRKNNSDQLPIVDRAIVYASSMFVVGSLVWVPLAYIWAWKKWKSISKTDKKRRAMYAAFLLSLAGLAMVGPHRSPQVGKWLQFRRWKLWKAWLNFIAFEVVSSSSPSSLSSTTNKTSPPLNRKKDQVIYAIIPHGIIPFAMAFSALSQDAAQVFGRFRPVAATATAFFPFVRSFLGWSDFV